MGAFAPGQEKAPGALRKAGLVEQLARAGVDVDAHGDLAVRRWVPDRAHHTAQHALVIGEVVRETSTAVERMMANGQAALVLGGDCTIELGTVSGVLSTG
jgi:arginase